MKNDKHTVRYSGEEIDAMIALGEDRSDLERVRALTDDDIESSIDRDDEGTPDWSTARIGIPNPGDQLTLPVDADAIHWFQVQGPGLQTRINAVLRSYVEAHKRAS